MSDASDLVFLATCQRVIWMFWGGDGTTLGFGPDIDCFEGEAAWRHLLEVATGLNSANLGDREVVGQIRQALDVAKEPAPPAPRPRPPSRTSCARPSACAPASAWTTARPAWPPPPCATWRPPSPPAPGWPSWASAP